MAVGKQTGRSPSLQENLQLFAGAGQVLVTHP
jgi:hypothetical protein